MVVFWTPCAEDIVRCSVYLSGKSALLENLLVLCLYGHKRWASEETALYCGFAALRTHTFSIGSGVRGWPWRPNNQFQVVVSGLGVSLVMQFPWQVSCLFASSKFHELQSLILCLLSSVQFSCSVVSHSMNRSTPGLPVHHQLPKFTQTHVHRVGDAIQPSHPLSSPSPPALNLSKHQGLFQWVNSSHEVAKVLGVSASASVLPMNTQDWSPFRWTGWISLQSKGLSRVFSSTIAQKHQFLPSSHVQFLTFNLLASVLSNSIQFYPSFFLKIFIYLAALDLSCST